MCLVLRSSTLLRQDIDLRPAISLVFHRAAQSGTEYNLKSFVQC